MVDASASDALAVPLAEVLPGRSATALQRAFGFATVNHLLRHYPRRYDRRGELTDLATLVEGDAVTVLAEVKSVTVRQMKSRRGSVLQAIVTDGTGELTLTWFSKKNQEWRAHDLRPGRRGLFSGQVTAYGRTRQLAHPDMHLLPDGVVEDPELGQAHAGQFIAIYPATLKVPSMSIAKAIATVLDLLPVLGPVPDPIPDQVRLASGFLDLAQALTAIHRPVDQVDIDRARERLAYEEAFVLQAELARRRHLARSVPARARARMDGPLLQAFDERLPFALTDGQRQVGEELAADLASETPMHRLLQGEVGSGKTVVALRAMLAIVDSGSQAALLAPTEVLAAQHYRSITAMLGPLAQRGFLGGSDIGTRVALLTGSQRAAARRRELIDVFTGDAGIVVGTHALLSESVVFGELGLVVVDEQHRFGVQQRSVLTAKAPDGTRPHLLVMTATPIPRTVAMTVFGDLDVSTLEHLPVGRRPIATHVVPVRENPAYVRRAWERVREEVARGHRVYVVCPRIGGDDLASDALGGDDLPGDARTGEALGDDTTAEDEASTASVVAMADLLGRRELAGLSLGVMHGRLPAEEKDAVMRRFADPEATDPVQVLVSTTVVEVGVDVPAATVMIVVDADRFGMSQLHQLRGRVGRGQEPGLCLLFSETAQGSPARARLDAVAATTDGFELARLDLQARREGDVLGADQSGHRSSLRLLEAVRDEAVILRARSAAADVVQADPTLTDHPALARSIDAMVGQDQAGFMEKS